MKVCFFNAAPYLMAILASIFWAGNITISKLGIGEIPPIGLSFWRWFFALIIIFPFVLRPMYNTRNFFISEFKLIMALSFFGIALYNSFIYLALNFSSALNVSIILSVTPILILVLSSYVEEKPIYFIDLVAFIISLLGVVWIVLKGKIEINSQFEMVEWIAVFAIISWAIYSVLLERLPRPLRGKPILGYTITIGVIMIAPFYLLEITLGYHMPINNVAMISVIYTGLFSSVFAFLLWNSATYKLGASVAGQFMHLVPVFSIIFAMIFLDERIYNHHFWGMSLVLIGLVLANPIARDKVLTMCFTRTK